MKKWSYRLKFDKNDLIDLQNSIFSEGYQIIRLYKNFFPKKWPYKRRRMYKMRYFYKKTDLNLNSSFFLKFFRKSIYLFFRTFWNDLKIYQILENFGFTQFQNYDLFLEINGNWCYKLHTNISNCFSRCDLINGLECIRKR